MSATVLRLNLAAVVVFTALACDLTADEPQVAYADDFSSVAGQLTTNLNGFYEDSSSNKTRHTFTYMGEDTVVGGDLVLSILEDDERNGPDGKPGVLSLKYDDVPKSADYSGFVYHGRVKPRRHLATRPFPCSSLSSVPCSGWAC